MVFGAFDNIPLWAVFVLTTILLFLSAELGYQVGRRRSSRYTEEGKKITGIILGAALGMLAFLLAFTFGMAGSVNRERKQLVLEEANAIGTTYLRAQLLPKKQCAEIQRLLRKYVDIRADIRNVKRVEDLKPILLRSEEVHDQLWTQAVDLVDDISEPIFVGLFVESLNEVIDLNSKRLTAGLRSRIPNSIMLTLYFVAILTMVIMGYNAGISGARTVVTRFLLVLAFSSVLVLITELDRPRKTVIKINQQAMVDLQNSMKKSKQ